MNDSILTSVKKVLGISEEYEQFDQDVIMHINTAFMVLTQIGVGPAEGFSITDKEASWDDFFADNNPIEGVKTYVTLKVRLLFDPPTSSSVMEAINRTVNELEWRLNVAASNTNE